MTRIFISYSAKDSPSAKKIAKALETYGAEPWLAEEQILPGDIIPDKISSAINDAEFFVVLLSRNSLESLWVKKELSAAMHKEIEGSSRIIPILLDNVSLPPNLQDILYIDFRQSFENGTFELIKAISSAKQKIDKFSLSSLFDTAQLAEELEKEQLKFKGAGWLITTILGIATLVLTGVSSTSSFHQVFKNQPNVFYTVSETTINIPPNTPSEKFYNTLIANNIAPSTLQIEIINKGDNVAKEVQAGILLPKDAIYSKTDPPESPSPIWVKIETNSEKGDEGTYYTYKFNNLIQDKPVVVSLGYQTLKNTPNVEVIYDGKPATKVGSLETARDQTFYDIFQKPIKVFMAGFLITVFAGLIIVLVRNPRLWNAMLLIIKEINPTFARVADIVIKFQRHID